MAVGGVPDYSAIGSYDENIQEQNDEILALESIFEGDEGRIEKLSSVEDESQSDGGSMGNMLKLYIPVKTSDSKIHVDVYQPVDDEAQHNQASPGVTLARSESGQRLIWSFEVSYLTPLCLHVTLPDTYPSSDAPSFVMSCLWLSPTQMTVLCQELDRLWMENKDPDTPGMPILYTWVDWLQENILTCLGIESQISVTSHIVDEEVDDCRVVMDTTDIDNIVTTLMRYNKSEEVREFYKADHECDICLDISSGKHCLLLTECMHHACKQCMTEHCQLLVKDGTVQHLTCPSYKCKCTIPPFVLQEVLTQEQFKRFEDLALQKALDIMGDVTYCPRCNNVVIREPEKDLNLGHCLVCFFSFCVDCQERWHPGEVCAVDEAAMAKQAKAKLELLKTNTKKEYEIAEILRVEELRRQKSQSYAYINKMAIKCPRCSARIMKTMGCNKVTCSMCNTSICFVCGVAIEGYTHFSDSPKCNTFSEDRNRIDNTDIVDLYAQPPVQPFVPRHLQPVQSKSRDIQLRLDEHPELVNLVLKCPVCRQKNIKEDNCNLLHCWNCKTCACFDCKSKIVGAVGKHYMGKNACLQHS